VIPLITDLPEPIELFTPAHEGSITFAKARIKFVVHFTDGSPKDGLFTAQNCVDGKGGTWHRSVGLLARPGAPNGGQVWRHTPDWKDGGVLELGHDLGVNDRSVGMEHTGNETTNWLNHPVALNASAREVALFCIWQGRPPTRGPIKDPATGRCSGDPDGNIVGHRDDDCYAPPNTTTSTHTDPYPNWPWAEYLDLCNRWYDHLKGDDDMPDPRLSDEAVAFLNSVTAGTDAGAARSRGAHLAGLEQGTMAAENGEPRPTDGNWLKTGFDAQKAANQTRMP
jgi:hypothetical protein